MRKIALKGLIGQKKETFLLWIVVTLSFLFLILSTTIITSLQKTDEAQRFSTYGSWQIMAFGLQSDEAFSIYENSGTKAVLPLVNVSGTDYFTGDNEYYITVCSDDFTRLGNIQLKEGRWPENDNEIVLEYARLSSLGLETGDSFTVVSEVVINENPSHTVLREKENREILAAAKENFILEQLENYNSGAWKNMVNITSSVISIPSSGFFDWYGKRYTFQEVTDLFDGKTSPLETITEDELRIAAGYYFEKNSRSISLINYLPEGKTVEKENISDLIGSGKTNIRVSGRQDKISIFIPKTFTVCGVAETFSDRWDTGMMPLPSGFITQICYDDYITCQNAVLEKYNNFEFTGYDHTVFISSENDSAKDVFDVVCKEYNVFASEKTDFHYVNYVEGIIDDKKTSQFGFDFSLINNESGNIITLSAYLVPENPFENYESSCSISENKEQYDFVTSVPISSGDFDKSGGEYISVYQESGFPVYYRVPELSSSSVIFEYSGEHYEISYSDFTEGNFSVPGYEFYYNGTVLPDAYNKQDDFSELRFNRFAYPSSSEGNDRMLVLVMIILFIMTVAAVFQIFFTQMKKRLRRIVLMKSIGAKSSQIGAMLIWEFIYFLAASLPIGILIGLGGAYLSTGILGNIQERTIIFTIDPLVFVFAIIAGTLALFSGMLIPMIMAVGVPLTGRTVRKKPLSPPKKETVQSFRNVTIRGLFANRTRTLGNFALCVFMMLITTLCLFIGFRFLTPYRETVQRDARPDYFLQLPFSASDRQLPEYIEELEALGICESIEVQRTASDGVLEKKSEESVLLETAFRDNYKTITDSFGADDFSGYPIELFCISSESETFEKLSASVTSGNIDREAFEAGKEIILMVPLYNESGKINENAIRDAKDWDRVSASGTDITFYEEYKNFYDTDKAYPAGSYITIGAQTRYMGGSSYTYKIETSKVKIGAVINYFPDGGIWPISGSDEGYQIICSSKLATDILPNAMRTRSSNEIRAFKIMYMSTGYGTTDFYINAKDDISKYDADTKLLIYARNEYMDIEFYHESNSKLLQDGINNVLLVCLLGLTAVLLALIIFSNTVSSDIEQERNRIGILQSLGVSNKQLIMRQLCIGLAASTGALLISNTMLWGFVALYSFISGDVIGNLLWGYPWWLHAILCLVLAVIITLLYILPMHGLRHYLPIENIKTRK